MKSEVSRSRALQPQTATQNKAQLALENDSNLFDAAYNLLIMAIMNATYERSIHSSNSIRLE
jgi:hypothetical protein